MPLLGLVLPTRRRHVRVVCQYIDGNPTLLTNAIFTLNKSPEWVVQKNCA